jgi:hypothetical protein
VPTNDWQIGVQYEKNWNNIAWQQSAPFQPVYPQQITGNSNLLTNLPFSEASGTWVFGCGHYTDEPLIFQDYDYDTNMSAALVCCPLCSYVNRAIEPYTLIQNPLEYAVIVP